MVVVFLSLRVCDSSPSNGGQGEWPLPTKCSDIYVLPSEAALMQPGDFLSFVVRCPQGFPYSTPALSAG
jgi:hypothetical protein